MVHKHACPFGVKVNSLWCCSYFHLGSKGTMCQEGGRLSNDTFVSLVCNQVCEGGSLPQALLVRTEVLCAKALGKVT